jgi:hypothetical protein
MADFLVQLRSMYVNQAPVSIEKRWLSEDEHGMVSKPFDLEVGSPGGGVENRTRHKLFPHEPVVAGREQPLKQVQQYYIHNGQKKSQSQPSVTRNSKSRREGLGSTYNIIDHEQLTEILPI